MGGYFAAFNQGAMTTAARYLDSSLARACGGTLNWVFAYTQLRNTEHLDYTLDAVVVTSVAGNAAEADVTFSSKDNRTGKVVEDHFPIGLHFSNDPLNGWVLAEDWLGVKAFCR